ncbi:MAG: tRNA pseudouridine(38-40) synthase TruA [Planctomycetes bacterium]|nr:tRNA pseudouridine(38-40) synthase TruA [Planctomycetota bacterium]
MTIEYDGTDYHGWQRQPDPEGRPTVQGAVETALARVVGRPVRVQGASRTDAGVHALGQVAHFEASWPRTPRALQKGVNALLPLDVVVRELSEVSPAFHARFGARGKWYRYTLRNTPHPGALDRDRVHWVKRVLDTARMREAAGHLLGTHDFRCFQKEAALAGGTRSTVRTIHRLDVVRRGPYVHIDAVGDAFLYHMVRAMAGTLVQVGLGLRAPGELPGILASGLRSRSGANLPARGLCLMAVHYEGPQ